MARISSRRGRGRPAEVPVGAGWAAAEVETALTVPADPSAAAFFDVDNTMMQGASIYHFARGLASRRYFTTGDLPRFGWQQLRFRILAAEHAGDTSDAKQGALALAAAEGLDLARCSAYSDSVNDIPMLSLVGHAVAVNPDSGLRREARQRGWEIRDFRSGRKAAKVAVPAAAGTVVAVGAVAAGVALSRRRAGA